MSDLQAQFGEIDIYLFDQLLRGRLVPGTRILDVGCGSGRNLVYLLRAGYQVFGVDPEPGSIQAVQQLASRLAPDLPSANFRVETIERSSLPDAFADVVLGTACSSVPRDVGTIGFVTVDFDNAPVRCPAV